MSYHLSRLWCDMICSRLNSRATQTASKTAERQRFRGCVYVVSPQQGHLATPSSPTPTVLYLVFLRASLCPARIDGLAVYAIRREAVIIRPRWGGSWGSSPRHVLRWAHGVDGFCGYSNLAYTTQYWLFTWQCVPFPFRKHRLLEASLDTHSYSW